MIPKWHIITGLLFGLLLWLVFPKISLTGAIIVFLASVLIDFDHYVYYVYKTGKFGFRGAFSWYFKNKEKFYAMTKKERSKIYVGLYLLHGVEAIVILIILQVITENPLFSYIIIGFVFHQILDVIDLTKKGYRLDKVISYIYSIKNSKGKKLLQEI